MTYTYQIPGNPITKKNHQQICVNKRTGARFVRQSKSYEEYEITASYYLQPKPPRPISGPVSVRCVYFMPTRRRVDLTNLLAATHDILVTYFILADDNRDVVASVDGSRVYYDKHNPRVEITITDAEPEYTQWDTKKGVKSRESLLDLIPGAAAKGR